MGHVCYSWTWQEAAHQEKCRDWAKGPVQDAKCAEAPAEAGLALLLMEMLPHFPTVSVYLLHSYFLSPAHTMSRLSFPQLYSSQHLCLEKHKLRFRGESKSYAFANVLRTGHCCVGSWQCSGHVLPLKSTQRVLAYGSLINFKSLFLQPIYVFTISLIALPQNAICAILVYKICRS